MTRIAAILFVVALACAGARAAERMAIGYVDVQDDPRHKDRLGFGGILLEQRGRAYDGAALAMADLAVVGATVGIDPVLVEARAESAEALAEAIEKLRTHHGARFVLVDATPAAFYAWGYGGQFVYVVPSRDLVVVVTTDWNGLSEVTPQALADQALGVIVNDVVPAAR